MSARDVGRDSPKFMLRFPGGMRDEIAAAAKANNRSMNAEIIARLEQTLANRPSTGVDLDRLVEDLGQRMIEVMHRSLNNALLGPDAKDPEPSGLRLLEWLRANHVLESKVLAEEKALTELQAINNENRLAIQKAAPLAHEQWKKEVRKRLPKAEADAMIAMLDRIDEERAARPPREEISAIRALSPGLGRGKARAPQKKTP